MDTPTRQPRPRAHQHPSAASSSKKGGGGSGGEASTPGKRGGGGGGGARRTGSAEAAKARHPPAPASSISLENDPAVLHHSSLSSSRTQTSDRYDDAPPSGSGAGSGSAQGARATGGASGIESEVERSSRARFLRNSMGLNLATAAVGNTLSGAESGSRDPTFRDPNRRQFSPHWATQGSTSTNLSTTSVPPITIPGGAQAPARELSSSSSPAQTEQWESSPSSTVYSRWAPPGYQPPPVKYPPKPLLKASITTSAPITASSSFSDTPRGGGIAPPPSPLTAYGDGGGGGGSESAQASESSNNKDWIRGAATATHASIMQLQERVSSALASHAALASPEQQQQQRQSPSSVSSLGVLSRRESISALSGTPTWRNSSSSSSFDEPFGGPPAYGRYLEQQHRDSPVPSHFGGGGTATSTPAATSRLTEHLRQLYAENLALQSTLCALERDLSDEHHRVRELSTRLATAEAESRVSQMRANDLELRLAEAVDEIVRFEDEANALSMEREELLTRNTELITTRSRRGSTLGTVGGAVPGLKSVADQKMLEKHVKELEKDKAALVSDRTNLVDRLANSELDKAALAGRLLVAEQDARQLGGQIAQLGQRVHQAQIHIVETAARQAATIPTPPQFEDDSPTPGRERRRYSREQLLELKRSPLVGQSEPDLSSAPRKMKPSSYPPQPYPPPEQHHRVSSGLRDDPMEDKWLHLTDIIWCTTNGDSLGNGVQGQGQAESGREDRSAAPSPSEPESSYLTPEASPIPHQVAQDSEPGSNEIPRGRLLGSPEAPIEAPITREDYDSEDPLRWAVKVHDYAVNDSEPELEKGEEMLLEQLEEEIEGGSEHEVKVMENLIIGHGQDGAERKELEEKGRHSIEEKQGE